MNTKNIALCNSSIFITEPMYILIAQAAKMANIKLFSKCIILSTFLFTMIIGHNIYTFQWPKWLHNSRVSENFVLLAFGPS